MVRAATTGELPLSQLSFPKPFCHTAAPRRPTTTAAPGYPPAEMPRSMTWSILASRSLDMPTARGVFTGRPPPSLVATVSAENNRNSTYGLLDQKRAELPTTPGYLGCHL